MTHCSNRPRFHGVLGLLVVGALTTPKRIVCDPQRYSMFARISRLRKDQTVELRRSA